MPNQRKKDKRLVGFYASPEEEEAFKRAAEHLGMNGAEFLRYVIERNDPESMSSRIEEEASGAEDYNPCD